MNHRAVGRLCALDPADLELPVDAEQVLAFFQSLGYQVKKFDLLTRARSMVGRVRYRRGAPARLAPRVVDCSGFVKWIYARAGIWLPRFAIQQSDLGRDVLTPVESPAAGDLVFAAGRFPFARRPGHLAIGHVGLATGEGTVVHASSERKTVSEVSWSDFVYESGPVLKLRRLVDRPQNTFVLQAPPGSLVEIADDFRWLFLSQIRQ